MALRADIRSVPTRIASFMYGSGLPASRASATGRYLKMGTSLAEVFMGAAFYVIAAGTAFYSWSKLRSEQLVRVLR